MSLDITLIDKEATGPAMYLYYANTTNNHVTMATAAQLHEIIWEPEKFGYVKAGELLPILARGVGLLASDPKGIREHESGDWCDYFKFLQFAVKYLEACQNYPHAEIDICS